MKPVKKRKRVVRHPSRIGRLNVDQVSEIIDLTGSERILGQREREVLHLVLNEFLARASARISNLAELNAIRDAAVRLKQELPNDAEVPPLGRNQNLFRDRQMRTLLLGLTGAEFLRQKKSETGDYDDVIKVIEQVSDGITQIIKWIDDPHASRTVLQSFDSRYTDESSARNLRSYIRWQIWLRQDGAWHPFCSRGLDKSRDSRRG